MTVTWQEKHQRYRVYISLGKKRGECKQKTFYPSTYGSKRKAKAAAVKLNKEWEINFKPVNQDFHPFALAVGLRQGTRKQNPIEVRHIQLRLCSNNRSHPDWSIKGNSVEFHTYAPTFLIQIVTRGKDGRSRNNWSKTVRIDSSRSYKLAWAECIDHYLIKLPQYQAFEDELIKACPTWDQVWEYLLPKAIAAYGEL